MSQVPVIPENAPFTPAQRLWLNGFLAGLFATESVPGSSAAPALPSGSAAPGKLLILYGSQTGTAEALAARIGKQATAHGCHPRVVDAALHESIQWAKESHLLIVTSTYGDGDMPDNAQAFWDWLSTDAASALSHLRYSVLALGDTTYSEFCAAGKKFDARLEALGAKRLHPRVDCDLDYEAAAETWTKAALAALQNGAPSRSAAPLLEAKLSEATGFNKANPYPARLVANRLLSGESSEKETRHFEFNIEGALTYECGDALGVYPRNCPALVNEILTLLGCDGEEAVAGATGAETPLRKALTESYDITKPSSELIALAARNHSLLRDLQSTDKKEELKTWLWGREVIDLLLLLEGEKPDAVSFVALLKKLAPRLYSISSSPAAHAGQVHLTIGVVRHDSHGRKRKGVCSTFLADRAGAGVSVPVYIQTSHGFRLPKDGATPIIMVGPGTGIAPFRGFLHERRATGAVGRNWLFFGEQRSGCDFYYRDELEEMLSDGFLTRLSTAFSRDQANRIYVQHRMTEQAGDIWDWLQDGAHFYVCGDASRMAKDVDAALHSIAMTAGGLSPEAAADYIQSLKSQKRYQRDVY